MAEYWGVKVEDIFNSMKERFRPDGAKNVDAVFGYDIQDEGKWKLTVKNNDDGDREHRQSVRLCLDYEGRR